jgi:hypothetical protein
MTRITPPYTIGDPIPVAEFREATAKRMSEKQLLQYVLDLARACGYLVYHTFDSRRSTPGFPDIIAVGYDRLLAIECKREGQHPTPEQDDWLSELAYVPGVACYVVRPSDWLNGEVERILRGDPRSDEPCARR